MFGNFIGTRLGSSRPRPDMPLWRGSLAVACTVGRESRLGVEEEAMWLREEVGG